MNTIIIYSSKYGSTADCAIYLEGNLPGTKTLVDIGKTKPEAIHLEDYDTIIIGSSVYVGAVSKRIRTLSSERTDLLLKKKVGIFLCCGFSEQSQEYFTKNFTDALLKHAKAVMSFGGEARLEKMNTIDRLIMKTVTKGNTKSLSISQEMMDQFVEALNL